MKIRENTSSRLVVTEKPVLIGALMLTLFGINGFFVITEGPDLSWFLWSIMMIFVVVIPLVMHYSVHWVTASFNRPSGRVEITRNGIAYYKRDVLPLRSFDHARIDEQSDSDGTTARVVLVFNEDVFDELPTSRRPKSAPRAPNKRWSIGDLEPHEIPITYYFSGGNEHEAIADAINEWVAG